jgi:Domain of unknown function (DUF4160)
LLHVTDGLYLLAKVILEGTFRTAKLKLVQAWIEIHQEELMTDWNRAVSGQSVFKIELLR